MGTPAISARAIARPVASPSVPGGRVRAWYLGAVWPLRSASATRVSITPPFSACMQISPPFSRVRLRALKIVASSTIRRPG